MLAARSREGTADRQEPGGRCRAGPACGRRRAWTPGPSLVLLDQLRLLRPRGPPGVVRCEAHGLTRPLLGLSVTGPGSAETELGKRSPPRTAAPAFASAGTCPRRPGGRRGRKRPAGPQARTPQRAHRRGGPFLAGTLSVSTRPRPQRISLGRRGPEILAGRASRGSWAFSAPAGPTKAGRSAPGPAGRRLVSPPPPRGARPPTPPLPRPR